MTNTTESPKTKLAAETALKDLSAAAHELPINSSQCERNAKTLTAAKLLLFGVCAAIDNQLKLECDEPIANDLEQALGLMSVANDHLVEDLLSENMVSRRSRERFRELSAEIDSLQMALIRVEGIKDAIKGSDDDECPF